ncbi:MAG: hypothetical protein IPK15_22195 [Verrucomicrobia bacterium]|nr:hypothetical protein [Verrucomicrobiota bacterium]
MQLNSQQKIIAGFVIIMAAAAGLAFTALLLFHRLEVRVDALAGPGRAEPGRISPGASGTFIQEPAVNSIDSLRQEIFFSYRTILVVGAAGTAISLICIWFIGRKLTQLLRRVALSLKDSSGELLHSTNQVANSSRVLAENACDAAASIEETSSSLEQMASMTLRNAEHAQSAKDLARHVRSAADTGAADMTALYQGISEIKSSSDDIARIVQTIDEIAFQTNILALNAAVEAARAGEAGQGFAVVADEVRSLAQRSAHAARETAERIQGAIAKTATGVQFAGKVSSRLQEIVEGNQKLDAVASEVASASSEQSKGIELLRSAVCKMDQVTQGNAATADSTAEFTSNLHRQARLVSEAVAELTELVGEPRMSSTTQPSRPLDAADFRRDRIPTERPNAQLRP